MRQRGRAQEHFRRGNATWTPKGTWCRSLRCRHSGQRTGARTPTLRDGVKFQDGETFDAEAARATLEHYKKAKISLRKAELGPVSAVEVVDPRTVRIDLAQAYAPLTAVLADRAGMMLAPKAMVRLDDNLASELGAIKLDRIVYRPIPNTSVRLVDLKAGQLEIAERLAAMADQAGFDVRLQALDATTQVATARAGDYEATLVIWSGRPDPDENVSIWLQCNGFLNWGRYCNKGFDALLAQARAMTDVAARQAVYREVVDMYLRDNQHIALYHCRWLWGVSDRVQSFVPDPDGLIRPQGSRSVARDDVSRAM